MYNNFILFFWGGSSIMNGDCIGKYTMCAKIASPKELEGLKVCDTMSRDSIDQFVINSSQFK